MCSGGFLPHVTVPTRFATNSCSLHNQIYIWKEFGVELVPLLIDLATISNYIYATV